MSQPRPAAVRSQRPLGVAIEEIRLDHVQWRAHSTSELEQVDLAAPEVAVASHRQPPSRRRKVDAPLLPFHDERPEVLLDEAPDGLSQAADHEPSSPDDDATSTSTRNWRMNERGWRRRPNPNIKPGTRIPSLEGCVDLGRSGSTDRVARDGATIGAAHQLDHRLDVDRQRVLPERRKPSRCSRHTENVPGDRLVPDAWQVVAEGDVEGHLTEAPRVEIDRSVLAGADVDEQLQLEQPGPEDGSNRVDRTRRERLGRCRLEERADAEAPRPLADLARVVEREEGPVAIQEPAHADAVDSARFVVALHHRQRQIGDMAERGVMGVAELEGLERRRELPRGPDDEAAMGADADVRPWLEHDGIPDPVGVGQRLVDRGRDRRRGRGEPDGIQRLEEPPLEQARAERIRRRMSDVGPVAARAAPTPPPRRTSRSPMSVQ